MVSKPQAAAGCLQSIAKNATLFGTAEENRRSLRVRLANHAGNTGFDYSGFLRGNLSKRMPEQVGVIHADIGDNTQYRLDNIGGIQQPSQADFDHGYIHVLLHQPAERHSRGDLEERGLQFGKQHLMVFNKTCHKSLGNKGKTYLSGIIMAGTPALNHTHPFAERHKMR